MDDESGFHTRFLRVSSRNWLCFRVVSVFQIMLLRNRSGGPVVSFSTLALL